MPNITPDPEDKERFHSLVSRGYLKASRINKCVAETPMSAADAINAGLELIEDKQMVVSNYADHIDWSNCKIAADSIGGNISRTVDCRILKELGEACISSNNIIGNIEEPISSTVLRSAKLALLENIVVDDFSYCAAIPAVWYTSLTDITNVVTGEVRIDDGTKCRFLSHALIEGANLGGKNIGFLFPKSCIHLSVSDSISTNLFIEPIFRKLVGVGRLFAKARVLDPSSIIKIQGRGKIQ